MKTSTPRRAAAPNARLSTLWSQHVRPDARMLALTVGDDRKTDERILAWDILGSLGHAEGLRASGLLTAAEHGALQRGLRAALAAARAGRLVIGPQHEDAHSAVEDWLTKAGVSASMTAVLLALDRGCVYLLYRCEGVSKRVACSSCFAHVCG